MKTQTHTGCQGMDVAIMLDSSGSIATSPQISPFRAMKNFVKNIISRLQTGLDSQAVIHFSSTTEIVFNFTTFSSKDDIYNAIDNILAFNENTNIAGGLKWEKYYFSNFSSFIFSVFLISFFILFFLFYFFYFIYFILFFLFYFFLFYFIFFILFFLFYFFLF